MSSVALRAQPTVSVVIPAFNAERTLAATLDSIVAQTVPPLEVVVVDDASTDGTASVARRYGDRLPRLQVIEAPHGGVGAARNIGIRQASGKLIAPLDADDIWHPTYIEKMTRRFRQAEAEPIMLYAGFRRVDLDGRIIAPGRIFDVSGAMFNHMLVENVVGNGSGMMFSREPALAFGLYDETGLANEDVRMQLELAWHGPVAAVPECLVGYRDVPGSLSKRITSMAGEMLVMLDELARKYPGIDPVALRLGRAHAHGILARALVRARGNIPAVVQHAVAAMRLDPSYMPRLALAAAARLVFRRLRRPTTGAGPDFFAVDTTSDCILRVGHDPRLDVCARIDARHVFPVLHQQPEASIA